MWMGLRYDPYSLHLYNEIFVFCTSMFYFLYFKNINFVKKFSIRLDDRGIINN